VTVATRCGCGTQGHLPYVSISFMRNGGGIIPFSQGPIERYSRTKKNHLPGRSRRRGPLTVCIAAIFVWKYGENDIGRAIVTMSDRQITAHDIEYEPATTKACFITPHTVILIAGDYSTHSEAIVRTQRQLAAQAETDPGRIANIYAGHVKAVKADQAARLYLSPIWLDHDSFLARQKELAPDLLNKLTDQLQNYRGEDTEAIIAGTTGNEAHIYVVDHNSFVQNYSDVGFAAIGIGAWHAKSQMMRAAYSRLSFYTRTVGIVYASKRAAEIAPGVGKETDAYLITRFGIEPLWPEFFNKTKELYTEYETKRDALVSDGFTQLNNWLLEYKPPATGKADITAQPREMGTDGKEPKTPAKIAPETVPQPERDDKSGTRANKNKSVS
jgi:20S proteasome alpha/beta subunit